MNTYHSTATGQALIWCAAVVICITVSATGTVMGHPGKTFVGLISVIGIGAISWAFRLCMQTDRQIRRGLLDFATIMYGNNADLDALLGDPKRSWLADLAASKRYQLAQGMAYAAEVELAPYAARLDHNAMLLSAATKILPATGLLGTVYGMSIAMGSISEGMADTSDPAAMIASLRSTLQGISTAFDTTLIACFAGALMLAPISTIVKSQSRALISQTQRHLAMLQFPSPSQSSD
ncbi:MotA/TolQ/ExbB proton channel family protein [Roseimaritima sediminicola]|uniref:MotA/TolQ/ExbB proton channel family protein n=1 Tax=Roseimaritima sediminicola TaxID=2662066 RepID=UPI0012984144|nr:MotA/TolQ/ExbB proton channel family protein [Roseimaritima sediminicola]